MSLQMSNLGFQGDKLKGISGLGDMKNDFCKGEGKEFSEDISRRDWEGQDNMAQCIKGQKREEYKKEECL